jgi:putative ABC transport system permease protein
MIFSIVIYYTFVGFQYSEEIQEIIIQSGAAKSIFLMSSIILILFVAIFIIYSNNFFTKKRKKEVGLYSMVGLPKKTIGKMLFYENLLMGIGALIIGITTGTLISRLFMMILIKLIGADVVIGLGLSLPAILNTLTIFILIIIFTSIQGYRLIYRFKLIELFKADNKGEPLPKLSIWIAIIAVGLFAISIVLVNKSLPRDNTKILFQAVLIISSIIFGTYLFFHSSVIYFIKFIQNNKYYHYRGTNLIVNSQLAYRIKGNTRTFTIIALLSALTISFYGSILSQYQTTEISSLNFAPFSYTHLSKGEDYDEKIRKIIEADTNHPILAQLDIPIIEAKAGFISPENYKSDTTKVISISTYNQVMKILNSNKYNSLSIKNNETIAIMPLYTNFTVDDYVGKRITLQLPNGNYELIFNNMLEDRVLTWAYPDFFIIVNDQTFSELTTQVSPMVFKTYEVENEKNTKETSDKLLALNPTGTNVFSGTKDNSLIFTYYEVYQSTLETNALNIFVIGFLGLVFLMATGSIIYFKQLTEANESKKSFETLKKIGLTKKELHGIVAKQNFIIFVLPFIIAIVDSIIILNFFTKFFSNLIGISIFNVTIIAILSFLMIYFIFYLLTIKTYNKIVIV